MISQNNKIRLAVIGIFLIAALAVVLDFPTKIQGLGISIPASFNIPFRLGLDLQGGAHLIYQADVSQIPQGERGSSLEGVRDVIERRVNAFGVAEPLVQTTKTGGNYRVIVELAGVTDVNQAIRMIGETPLLEFKELDRNPQIELTQEQTNEIEATNTTAKEKAQRILEQALQPNTDFSKLAIDNTEDEASAPTGGELGFVPRGLLSENFETVCFDDLDDGVIAQELIQTEFGYHIIKKLESREIDGQEQVNCSHILIRTIDETQFLDPSNQWVYTGLTGKQLKRSTIQFDQNTQAPQISLEFNSEGQKLFAEITQRNIGRPVGIFLDGISISVPVVQSVITSGRAVITGSFSLEEARLLSQRLNAGALPVPIELISQQTVGASLGTISLEKSLQAGMLGLLVVSIFMILYYRLPGLVAVVSLVFYGLVVIAIFKLVPVTITLAGTAGFILSLGFAVDANILIFERLKEELREGNTLPIAVDKGFKRAWPSIYDGNVSTIITCIILVAFTSSVVKGFAITLLIGILISMFTAMVVTKMLIKLIIQFKIFDNSRLFGVKR